MRTEAELAVTAARDRQTQSVQDADVCPHVIKVIIVRRIVPFFEEKGFWYRAFGRVVQLPLGQALIVNAVKTDNMLQKFVQKGVTGRVDGRLKQRLKYVRQHLLEVLKTSRAAQGGENAGNLNEPAHVGGEQAVADNPLGQVVPFARVFAVDADAILGKLIPERI